MYLGLKLFVQRPWMSMTNITRGVTFVVFCDKIHTVVLVSKSDSGYTGVLHNLPKHYIFPESLFSFSSIYPPRNVSEIKGKYHMESNQGHTSSANLKQGGPASSTFTLCLWLWVWLSVSYIGRVVRQLRYWKRERDIVTFKNVNEECP